MDIQIQRTAEALNQRDGAGVSGLVGEPRLPDQVHGDDTVDDTQHLPHDGRAAGKE